MEEARELLNSLMGMGRNEASTEPKQRYYDRDVCKFYLLGFCPHECFMNDKKRITANSPLGACTKYHSDLLKQEYEKAPDKDDHTPAWEEDLCKMLGKVVEQLDVKIKREQSRIDRINEEKAKDNDHARVREDVIGERLRQAERLAEEGSLEESQTKMREVETLRTECGWEAYMQHMGLDKILDVCHECGSSIDWSTPAQIRAREQGLDHAHTVGILHQGFKAIREKFGSLDKKYLTSEKYKHLRTSPSRKPRARSDSRRRGDDRKRSRDRRSRSRDRRRRSRSRRRSRDRRR